MRWGILIVEDSPRFRETMRKILAHAHPDLAIDVAETVIGGETLIRSAPERGIHYIIVILDIKLPLEPGGQETIHFGLRDRVLRSASSDAYIFYITAHMGDPVIQEYRRKLEDQLADDVQAPRTFFISKAKSEDLDRLYEKIHQIVHTRRIRQDLERTMTRMFGAVGDERTLVGGMAYAGAPDALQDFGMDATHAIARLVRDIEAHWNYLDGELKRRVQQYFVVTEMDDGVDLSLT